MSTIRSTPTRLRRIAPFALIGLTMVATGCSDDGQPDDSTSTAAEYCESGGGTMETRRPYWGTNLDQSPWVQLPGSIDLCRFEASDESRIYIDATSLAADSASLAASAYLAKLPMPSETNGGNPAAVMCQTTVGGTSSWGTSANGGGWVNLDDPTFTVVDLCVFPDGSAIDEWGIAYYSGDTVRGADLATKFSFDSDSIPPMFADGESS